MSPSHRILLPLALLVSAATHAESVNDVFVIAMENHNWIQPTPGSNPQQLQGNIAAPFLNSLVNGTATGVMVGGVATNISAQTAYSGNYLSAGPAAHPSETNYIWAEAGSNLGSNNDNDPYSGGGLQTTTNHLTGALQRAGVSWKTYQEDSNINKTTGAALAQSAWTVPLTSQSGTYSGTNAYNGSHQYNYAGKHNPMIFFTDTNGGTATTANTSTSNPEVPHYAPLQQLQTDLTNNTVARYNWITPNQFNDMHSGLSTAFTYNGQTFSAGSDQNAIAVGDNFLSIIVPQIMASAAYQNNGLIIIWFDESEGGDTSAYKIPYLVISKLAHPNVGGLPYQSLVSLNHSSDLRSMQELFGVNPTATGDGTNWINGAATANDISDLLAPGALTSVPEPADFGMIGAGALACVATIRRRSRRRQSRSA